MAAGDGGAAVGEGFQLGVRERFEVSLELLEEGGFPLGEIPEPLDETHRSGRRRPRARECQRRKSGPGRAIRVDLGSWDCFRRVDSIDWRQERMSNPETIICRPTKWFLWRAVAMLVLFGVFAVLFFKDWKVGYPQKNVEFYTHQAFEEAKAAFQEAELKGQTAEVWEEFAGAQKIYPEEEGILPTGVDAGALWPDVLVGFEAYKKVYDEGKEKAAPPGWLEYSHAQGWDSEAPESGNDAEKIRTQLYFGIGSAVLTVFAAFYLLRTGRRSMMVDDDAYFAPGGVRIPFEKIQRIDKRKWETKGLAYLSYEGEGGRMEKAKVDGMVYGQFREEDGAPAEALFQKILKNFKGELIELEPEEEDEEEVEDAEESKD